MATMAGKVRHIRDADVATELRAPGGAAVTGAATTVYPASGGKELGTLQTAYFDNQEIPWDSVGVQLVVTAIDVADTDEVYTFTLEVSDGTGFSPFVTVGTLTVNSVGAYIIQFDAKSVKHRLPGADHVRLKLVAAGTTPSINFYGWLVHVGH